MLRSAGIDTNDLVLEQDSLENELEIIVGDNFDMFTKVRQMTVSNQNKDHHVYQVCAYLSRVGGNSLDNTYPLQNVKTALFSQLISGDADHEKLMKNSRS